jgi:hypothetical protein
MRRWYLWGLAIAMVALVGCGGGGGGTTPEDPPPGQVYNLAGVVRAEGGAALSGATVTVIVDATDTELESTTTSSTGAYGFWIPADAYVVRAARTGYQTQEQAVTLSPGEKNLAVDFALPAN